jgi:hypothetical protein
MWASIRRSIFLGGIMALAASAVQAMDLDGGGISDLYEIQYGAGPLTAAADNDKDGLTNFVEYCFDTNPLVVNASPVHLVSNGAGGIEVSFSAPKGQRFQLQRTTNLAGAWSNQGTLFVGNDDEFSYEESVAGNAKAFFRVQVQGAGDQDGDGLDAFEESLLGTSDTNPDSESDGMPDGWEWTEGFDPLADDSGEDPDGDGRNNLAEYQQGSDPHEYYNGEAPTVVVDEGDGQLGLAEEFFGKSLIVRLTNQFSNSLINAPVTFTVTSGDGQLAETNVGSPDLSSLLQVVSDGEGKARVYLRAGTALGPVTVTVQAGTADPVLFHVVVTDVPLPLSGLQAWFRADQGVDKDETDRVTQWDDQTGLGNDATAVSGHEPLWRENRVNGLPSVYFDGNNESLQFPVQNGLRTVFLVVRHDTGSQDYAVSLGSQSTNDFHGAEGTGFLSASNAAAALVNGEGYVNGTPVAPASILKPKLFQVLSFVTTGNVLADQIGQDRNIPERCWQGDIVEIILYDETLTTTDREAVEAYLASQYATSDVDEEGGDGLIDYWELEWFGNYDQAGVGDYDGDGQTNQQEMEEGTDPTDYYNGQSPTLTKDSGDEQVGGPEEFLAAPVVVLVQDGLSQPLANAPVVFTVDNGGQLAETNVGSPTLSTELEVRTDENGLALVYVYTPPTVPVAFTITATATAGGVPTSVMFTAETGEVLPIPSTGLQAWYRADQGVQKDEADRVTQWEDQSGVDNHATAVSGQEPLWRENRVNGLPSVYFDGNNELLQFPTQSGLRTVFLVVRHDTGSQDFAIPLGGQGSFDFHGAEGTGFLSASNAAAALVNGEGYVNGTPVAPASILKPKLFQVLSFVTTGNVLADQIGQDRNIPERCWQGDIVEIILYDETLTTTDREAVEAYLASQYATSDVDEEGGDGLIDYWELEWFGNYDQAGVGDYDGDGQTNQQEMEEGTDPTDYYNGQSPTLTKDSGDEQVGGPEEFLAAPVVVLVQDGLSQPLANAPVVFTVDNGGQLAETNVGSPTLSTELEVRTDENGLALVYVYTPPTVPVAFTITATATAGGVPTSVMFTAETQ